VGLSIYKEQTEKAKLTNQTPAFQQAMRRRKTVIEGVIAHLKNLGLKIRLWGPKKVNIQGILSALAHNILKAVKKIKRGIKTQATAGIQPFLSYHLSRILRTYSVFKEPTQPVSSKIY